MRDFDCLGDRRRNAAAWRYRRSHARRVLLCDDATCGGAEPRKNFDHSPPIRMLQQERREQEIRPGFEYCMLDIVFQNTSAETMANEAFLKASEKAAVQVGARHTERAEQSRVQKIEHLAGTGSRNNNMAAIGRF